MLTMWDEDDVFNLKILIQLRLSEVINNYSFLNEVNT